MAAAGHHASFAVRARLWSTYIVPCIHFPKRAVGIDPEPEGAAAAAAAARAVAGTTGWAAPFVAPALSILFTARHTPRCPRAGAEAEAVAKSSCLRGQPWGSAFSTGAAKAVLTARRTWAVNGAADDTPNWIPRIVGPKREVLRAEHEAVWKHRFERPAVA